MVAALIFPTLMLNKIVVRGSRVHNLKNVSVDIPHNQIVVCTGLSGSGKSSLAFDTIFAEGQRRFMESLSSFTKQFMESIDKPDVDAIEGLPPCIAIDQRTSSASPRSTVGTATEIYDYLRLLYARAGTPHCPECGEVVRALSKQTIINTVREVLQDKPKETLFLAPIIKQERIALDRVMDELQRVGYRHVRIDKVRYELASLPNAPIDWSKKHTFEVMVEVIAGTEIPYYDPSRLIDIINTTMDLGNGVMTLYLPMTDDEYSLTDKLVCADCNITIDDLDPRNFSFNNPRGACPTCTGLGYLLTFDKDLLIPNKNLTIAQGAIQPLNKIYANNTHYLEKLEVIAQAFGFSIHTPIKDLSEAHLKILLQGPGKTKPSKTLETPFTGIIPYLDEKYRDTDSEYLHKELEEYMRIFPCGTCHSKRLRPEMLAVTVAEHSIDQVVALPIERLLEFFHAIDSPAKSPVAMPWDDGVKKIVHHIVEEATKRTLALQQVGLGYLILDRSMATLSGGEAQRVKLANQISSSLVGVVYVLDEPSIGLHPKDTEQLIDTLRQLRDSGNSVIVVEHDSAIIEAADRVIDVGPGAGKNGGTIIAEGTPAELKKNPKSITGQYLSGKASIATKKKPRPAPTKFLEVIGAKEFNLHNLDVKFPLGQLVCVTGVSGSGKSTLVIEILSKALLKKLYKAKDDPGTHKEIRGLELVDKAIVIDQSPIGRTPRSNPVTYTNIFTPIRELFTELPEAKIKGFKPGHFSFNVKGGRCETCQGEGSVRIDMRFLSDVYVECKECHGKRYNKEALEVHYEGLSIADVLDLTVDEAILFFVKEPTIHDKLQTLSDVGLGYLRLGQPANTLSGGEAQRIKLATELSRRSTGKTLYILDEPTTGLHFEDIKRLLSILTQLVDKGNTVLIIEHNLEVIATADWIIDLGPEGGDKGGYVVAEGTPAEVAAVKESWTGRYLKELMKK